MASARNADLVGADAMTMDRYVARSERTGHLPTASEDTRLRIHAFSSRAGDTYSVRGLLLRLNTSPRPIIHVADTTDRTDRDGTTARVPTWSAHSAPSSPLNSSLDAGGTYRDRFRAPLDLVDGVGFVHRIQFRTDGRAGSTSAPLAFLIQYAPSHDHIQKAAAT